MPLYLALGFTQGFALSAVEWTQYVKVIPRLPREITKFISRGPQFFPSFPFNSPHLLILPEKVTMLWGIIWKTTLLLLTATSPTFFRFSNPEVR